MDPERQNYWILLFVHDFWVTKNHEKSRTAKTLYFEGSIKRNACFHPSSPLIFASIFHPIFMFFLERLLDFVFSRFSPMFTGKVRFWNPTWSQWPPKCPPKSNILNTNIDSERACGVDFRPGTCLFGDMVRRSPLGNPPGRHLLVFRRPVGSILAYFVPFGSW